MCPCHRKIDPTKTRAWFWPYLLFVVFVRFVPSYCFATFRAAGGIESKVTLSCSTKLGQALISPGWQHTAPPRWLKSRRANSRTAGVQNAGTGAKSPRKHIYCQNHPGQTTRHVVPLMW